MEISFGLQGLGCALLTYIEAVSGVASLAPFMLTEHAMVDTTRAEIN